MIRNKNSYKHSKLLLKELPYYNYNIISCHGQFNNSIPHSSLPSKKQLQKLHSIHDLDIFALNSNIDSNINPDIQLMHNQIRANYFSPNSFNNLRKSNRFTCYENSFSILHNNVRSLHANFENFQDHLINGYDKKNVGSVACSLSCQQRKTFIKLQMFGEMKARQKSPKLLPVL